MDRQLGAVVLAVLASFSGPLYAASDDNAADALKRYSDCMSDAVARYASTTESVDDIMRASRSLCRADRDDALASVMADIAMRGLPGDLEEIGYSVVEQVDEESRDEAARLRLETKR